MEDFSYSNMILVTDLESHIVKGLVQRFIQFLNFIDEDI